MDEDLSVNYSELQRLIAFHLGNGTDTPIVTGTTGASALRTPSFGAKTIDSL